jgi:hypothetical protein
VSLAGAEPVLDGSRDASYGLPRAVQTVQTQFGDNLSELNAAYAQVDSGVLYLLLTGQVENNFNKLNIFIDSVAGGENVLTADAGNGGNNPENDGWANKHAGMTFDAGFAADYMIIARNGFDKFDIDYAVVGGGLGNFESTFDIFGGSLTGVNAAALPGVGIGVGYDNSNVAGVIGGTEAADQAAAAAVTTGLELAIPLAAIGNPSLTDIKVSAMVNNGSHDYLSNQFLGGLTPPQGNLGSDGTGAGLGNLAQIDLNTFAGNQFFVAIPEPGTLMLLALAGLGFLAGGLRKRWG